MSEEIVYLWEGVPAAGSFVVFIGAFKLKVFPPNPPQHSSQLLLQLKFPAKRKTPGSEINKDSSTEST